MRDHQWLISVLADLEEYSLLNGLPGVRNKINEAQEIAAEEILRVLLKGRSSGVSVEASATSDPKRTSHVD